MFTGIVEAMGEVLDLARDSGNARLTVVAPGLLSDARVGDSISVNGCCVTLTTINGERFTSDLMGETLDRTALGDLKAGDPVNLERALQVGSRLGGHLVQGHVDGVGVVVTVEPQTDWAVLRVAAPETVRPYLAEKGSVAIDGVSLTIMGTGEETFEVGLIPHTLAVTVLGRRRPGERVNLEADVIAKYVRQMVRVP